MKINNLLKTFTLGFFALAFFIFGLGFGKDASAAEYTVCSSGCSSTTLASLLSGNDLAGGDIVTIQADSPGGSKTFWDTYVNWTSVDGGAVGNPVTVKSRDGDNIILSGSYDTTNWNSGWTNVSGNIWSRVSIATQPNLVVYNNLYLIKNISTPTTPAENEFGWLAGTLYVNVGSDPSSASAWIVGKNNYPLFITADYVNFQNFSVQAANTTIGGAVYIDSQTGIMLDGLNVAYSGLHGIYADTAIGGEIKNCSISNLNGGSGQGNSGIKFVSGDISIHDNVINGGEIGIWYSSGTLGHDIYSNTIYGQNYSNAKGISLSGSLNNVYLNTIYSVGLADNLSTSGIYTSNTSDSNNIYSNTIRNSHSRGIALFGDFNVVYDNTIYGMGSSNSWITNNGIYITGNSSLVYSNAIYNIRGIGIYGIGDDNRVYNNNITACGYVIAGTFLFPDDFAKYSSGGGGGGIGFTESASGNLIGPGNFVNNSYQGISIQTTGGIGGNQIYYNVSGNSIVNDIGDYNDSNPANRNLFYNNTVYHNPSANNSPTYTGHGFHLQDVSGGGGKATFGNNICYNNVSSVNSHCFFITDNGGISSVYLSNNDWYSVVGGINVRLFNTTSYTSIPTYQTAIQAYQKAAGLDGFQINAESNSLFSDPLFNSSADFTLQFTSPAIDSGTSVGLTSDYAGNPIYGTPDIGAYEYQPPHTMGTNKIDIGAGARIYGDGKFRDLNTTNSELADLVIAPESGNFNSYNADEVRPEWMDIKNITWGDFKEWTESSPDLSLTNTAHVVGDLEVSKYYNVSVDEVLGQNIIGDNCTNGICKSNSEGKIIFTYTGTYSSHTFKVEAGDNINPTLTNNTNNKFSTETTSVNLSLTTDENSTCHYSNSSETSFDNATVFTTTGGMEHLTLYQAAQGAATYIVYAICRDSNNNESTHALSFEIAPAEAKEKISSPIIKTTQGKEKMKSNSTVYSDEKEIKLQGEDEKLANGKIKIYKNSKHIETTEADENGKWSKKIKLDKDFNGYLKVKLYNQYGTLVSNKKTRVKVDNEKPEITTFPKNLTSVIRGKTNLSFLAEDNNKVTSYKIYLGGNIYKTKTNSFTVPAKTEPGMQYLRIRAYDKAGNSTYKETFVLVK